MVILEGGTPSLLDADALAYLERRGEHLAFDEGSPILRRGETGEAFWVLLSGEVVRPVGWWIVVTGCTVYTFGSIFLVI